MAAPIVFAYDGSELAQLAIEEAGRQLAPGRDALVVCVWQPADVGFVFEERLDAQNAAAVQAAAEKTAAHGAALADQAGFRSESVAVGAAPTWQGIVEISAERDASLIVLGSHSRRGLAAHLIGSVAGAVVKHAATSVLVVHEKT
jgi:nucleotide-binding universal stress UspA family protein